MERLWLVEDIGKDEPNDRAQSIQRQRNTTLAVQPFQTGLHWNNPRSVLSLSRLGAQHTTPQSLVVVLYVNCSSAVDDHIDPLFLHEIILHPLLQCYHILEWMPGVLLPRISSIRRPKQLTGHRIPSFVELLNDT